VEPEPRPSYLREEPSFIREEPSILLQESSTLDQYAPAVDAPLSFVEPEPVDAEPVTTVSATIEEYVSSYAEPAVEAFVEPVVESYSSSVESYSSSVESYSYTDSAWTPQVRYPLTLRTAKGWWFVEGKFTSVKEEAAAGDPDSELREVLAGLAVPAAIAGVVYAEGCRIRRVRLAAA
jgi:hypothetical protein